jgi:hypothetical protein
MTEIEYKCGCHLASDKIPENCPVHNCSARRHHIEPLTDEQKQQVYELARRLAYGTTWEEDLG